MGARTTVVRRATLRDARALAEVFTDAFGPTSPADVRKGMRRRDCRQEYLVAVVGGVLAAVVIVQYRELIVDGVRIPTGGIAGVATRWGHRRRGLATRLMREAIRRIRARGLSNTSLFTGHHLPAIRIYERLGYSETADWRIFHDIRKVVPWLAQRFSYRSRWLPRTSYGKALLRGWDRRVLLSTPKWRATVSFDGRKFTVLPGRRGRPEIVMRGPSDAVLECFGNRVAYDRNVREGNVVLSGEREDLTAWRRFVTLEWRE